MYNAVATQFSYRINVMQSEARGIFVKNMLQVRSITIIRFSMWLWIFVWFALLGSHATHGPKPATPVVTALLLGNTDVTHPKQLMVKNENSTVCEKHKITHLNAFPNYIAFQEANPCTLIITNW